MRRPRELAFVLSVILGACRSREPESATRPDLPAACGKSTPVVISGQDSGVARCSTGLRHRQQAVACPSLLPRKDSHLRQRAPELFSLSSSVGATLPCLKDQDCSARLHGHCELTHPGHFTYCAYGCESDADCSTNELCLCGDPIGQCVPASCRTDADCDPPFLCADYEPIGAECGDHDAFACQTSRDECTVMCRAPGIFCTFSAGHRVCASDCAIY
jgi:hypothetical protein